MKYLIHSFLLLLTISSCSDKKDLIKIDLPTIIVDTNSNSGLFLSIISIDKGNPENKKAIPTLRGYVILQKSLLGIQADDTLDVETFVTAGKKFVKIDVDRNGNLTDEETYIINKYSKVLAIPVGVNANKKSSDTVFLKPFISTLFEAKSNDDLRPIGFLCYPTKKSGSFKRNNKFKFSIFRYEDKFFTTSNTQIEILKEYDSKKDIVINKVGDKIYLDRESFLITEVDPLGNYIMLAKQETYSRNTGYLQNDYAIDIKGHDLLTGNPFTLSSYYGKFVLLDFWGPWCKPCLKASPELKALSDKFHSSFQLIGVASDKDSLNIISFLKDKKINYPNVFEPLEGSISQQFAVRGYPTFILIDPDGKIIFRAEGLERFDELKEFIETTVNN